MLVGEGAVRGIVPARLGRCGRKRVARALALKAGDGDGTSLYVTGVLIWGEL